MHHVVVERWSRRASPLHARDARVKLAVLLVFLATVSTTPVGSNQALGWYALLLLTAAVASRLPLHSLIARVAVVLPFSAIFALVTWWAGDPPRAFALASKSFLSVFASLLLVATTPITELSVALDSWHLPRALVLVIQFLYRYLFVISEQAQHMRLAARSRGSAVRSRLSRFQSAAGALSVLFARSWERADGIYHAMLARGFQGHFRSVSPPHLHAADLLFLTLCVSACTGIRLAA